MSWTQTDTSFKKLSNKRITTSTGKGLPEEKGASTLELYLPDIKTGLIPGTGYAGYGASGYLFYHGPTASSGQTLAVDTSVPGNLTWFATSGWANTTAANDGTAASEAQRLGDWVSDKYDAFGTVPGAGYEIKVYDRNDNLITKSDNSNWLFDYQTGILVFNNDATSISTLISTSGPFKIVGWRYIGPKGIIPASYGGSGFTSYNLGDLIVGAGSTMIALPVGTNNYVLSADSSTPTGLKWVASSSSGSGISYLNNLTAGIQYFATGTSGVGFNISSSGSTHTFNIPIAGVGVTGLITGLAQTIEGSKTFTSAIIGDLVGTATTAGFAFTSNYAYQSGYAITSGFANTSVNLSVANADSGTFYPILSNTFLSTIGIGASVNGLFSFNVANGAFGATSVNISAGQSYSIDGNSVISSTSLGTGVTNSSLTALGVITTGTWSASAITAYYGGTGYNSYNKGDLLVGVGSTFIKLPVGSNNYVLAADSTTDSGLKWIANTGGGGGGFGASVYIGETPPPWTPNTGDFWWNSDNGALNIYYTDIDTSQWVEINSYFGGMDAPASFGIGITQINNIASSSQFLYSGFSGNTFNISSIGNSHTFNIPIAGVASTGLVSGLAQTFGGIKTFQNGLISGNGVTIYGSLSLPNQPLSSIYGGTGKTSYNLGDLLVGAGSSFISLSPGSNGYVLQSNTAYPSGLGWTYVSNVNVSETAPTPASMGDLWWNSVDGSLSVYFVDIDSTAQWVEVGNSPSTGTGTSSISGIYYLNGLYDNTQYLNVGAGNSFYVQSIANTHTIQIPLAGSGSSGLMSGIAQTFSGSKTFQNDVIVSGMLNFTFATIGTAGITTSPSIAFIGQTNNPITLNVLPDNSLSFDSASGQLFKISNDLLAEYIYSVNDVSGLPILRAKSDSTLTMAEYGSNVGIGLSNPAYKLQVVGDVYSTTSKASRGFIETVYSFGTTSGTITPNWNNGSTQTMTLNNNITLNAPISMPIGSSMKLVITQDVSGSRLLSPNGSYKFLGGVNTLSTAGNSIDIITIFYDGTNYLSEIKKGYS